MFTPQLEQTPHQQQQPGHAVIVWLHGGAFSRGSASPRDYGPERLLDRRDLVVVSLNYRLGALGFLTTGSAAAPPNLGLRDQQLALAWVRDNIRAFGGDPSRVTLAGQGSGATCVMAHLVSPLSAGLFQRAVAMSGVWGFHPFLDSRQEEGRYAALLAAELYCDEEDEDTGDSAEDAMIDCLRRRDAAAIVRAALKFQRYGHLPMAFKPMQDSFLADPVLPEDPWTSGRPHQDVPLLIGANRDEGIVSLLPFLLNETLYGQLEGFDTEGPVLLFGTDPSQVN